ncbi:MAG TPA: type II toxin-antitoxin system RelE/ParE family toxin [Candidatus Mediterraneibacter quadrami]|uniref:Type II toxin-antitoxin system RelE/ParE family toxin n=1 Tax=Candidatus Mediterraneibacter quadrami TaxID=2838684 RepID=A0A9D2RD33_9FIRM|nr:type II toxin-antitoxin system RelE/ParE family toxin [Candidatus Mediterraneibacter quadrami]
MEYKVIVSEEAEADLDRYIRYLFAVKRNEQAARNVLEDFEATVKALKNVAGSLKLCDNEQLRKQGYRRINFLSHRYFLIYRIVDDTVFVDNIFHEMQDYENKMM